MNNVSLKGLYILALREHFYCEEDKYYSCPKAPGGCWNTNAGQECNCGTEEHNKKATQIYDLLSAAGNAFFVEWDNK